MPDVTLLKLIVDLGILVSVAYLCVRVVRGAHDVKLTQLADLDSSLRTLMQQAERASATLGDELLKRQRDIERVLLDIEETERKVTHAVRTAEDLKSSIEHARREQSHSPSPPKSPSREELRVDDEDEIEVTESPLEMGDVSRESFEPLFTKAPEPPSFASRPGIYTAARSPSKATRREVSPEGPQSLAASIEREVSPPQSESAQSVDIQSIYDSAEEALRAGKDLGTVAVRTKLPIEEVRMLSEMIVRERLDERAAVPDTKKDPRLGVLGSMRREVTTL